MAEMSGIGASTLVEVVRTYGRAFIDVAIKPRVCGSAAPGLRYRPPADPSSPTRSATAHGGLPHPASVHDVVWLLECHGFPPAGSTG